MTQTLTYNVDLNNLKILNTEDEQHNFFVHGHPVFLIPDFCKDPEDIWLSFMDYIEKVKEIEIYDQNGGEVYEHSIIDSKTGLTRCKYVAYLQLTEEDEEKEYEVEIEGYIVMVDDESQECHFLATKVSIEL